MLRQRHSEIGSEKYRTDPDRFKTKRRIEGINRTCGRYHTSGLEYQNHVHPERNAAVFSTDSRRKLSPCYS
ncbi:hypothetical protein HMPREF1981_02973 [Bacteroides pyogenes F0041]|uniref:Uncharacterized protein n=1 Tax=Bacteroides pyogenes F0041 TaxID=1321819 RepID=U2DJW0_9BACE|nr:hypothetical protein HMPREF1981_02973 [Bacteroides pyogenes F0041]GAE20811.1 hypothetical protein JCM10003_186 [Bacteroides pyogenes JCM 10003]